MKRIGNHLSAAATVMLFGLCLAVAPVLQAQIPTESDISTTITQPTSISSGSEFTVTIGYANAGPTTAAAYINSWFNAPMGMDVFMDDYVNGDGDIWTQIQTSADGTDTLGNAPLLFWDDYFCEDLWFQVQRDDDDTDANPVEGLDPGVSASFSYELTIPMEEPRTGTIEIIEPASLVRAWSGTVPNGVFVLNASPNNLYGRGGCDALVNTDEEDVCEYINDNCFGGRVSLIPDPLETEWELVNDDSADPTFGCEALVGFTPGNVAVLRRGDCEFGVKAFNAEQAGAVATIIVNTDQCSDSPSDDKCVINLGAGALGGLVTTPVIMLAQADGEPIISAIEGGQTVRGIFGSADGYTTNSQGWLAGDVDTDPDETNDYDVVMSPISASSNPPVAAFTYLPAAPSAGDTVTFTDASTGAPSSWAWDFGDGGTSTDQNPSHTYTSGGTFSVSLTATNGGGSDMTSQNVTVSLGGDLTESYFIPAAALAAGAEGSFFQTDVDINNSGASEAEFAFLWLPRGVDNSSPTQSSSYNLAAGASIRFENVLAEVFGAEPDVAGALAVISNTADLKMGSRTYNVPTAKIAGTFGQALPGVPAAALTMQGETERIIFMSENDDLRANLGCVNGVNDSVRIIIDLFDDSGALLETKNMDLGPWSNNQFNRVFQSYAPTNGYATVRANKAGAAFYCYGSVLDNQTSDPTSILPVEYGADAPFVNYFIPAAALAAGAEGSFFQTDVDVNNAGDSSVTYNFMWLPRGVDNSSPTTSDSFTLAAGASVRYENVLVEVFGFDPDVSGSLAISADSADLGIMSRTYNVPTAKIAGTFGQALPGVPDGNLIMQGETQRIIFMSENDDVRANLGCVNGVADSVRVNITLYDDTGAMLETKNMDLPPWSNNQINQIFRTYAPTNGYADVKATKAGAAYYCYGSVLDNQTSDPTTILPQ